MPTRRILVLSAVTSVVATTLWTTLLHMWARRTALEHPGSASATVAAATELSI